ncbi:isthmin-2 isoform X1 [Nothobranchius furzeri]
MNLLWLLVLTASVCGLPARNTASSRSQLPPSERREDAPLNLKQLQQENLLQTHPLPSRHSAGLPPPTPEEEPFVLDLRNFPDLANADAGSQNPNIQVTIEVVEDPQTETEVEMDLVTESQRNNWSVSSSDWINSHKKLFWPLFWEYPEQMENGLLGGTGSEDYGDPDASVLGGVGGRWNTETKFENEEWTGWAPCSATCGFGSQKRTRTCGYACTATESRTCDLQSCPNAGMPVTEATLLQTASSIQSNVDSCEKWLSCRNEFLQKYLHQVLTELPSCPCSYPSEVVYGAVNLQDVRLRKTYRWRDASGPKERLDIYKPSARFCIRSMLSYDSTTLAAQHCCYDDQMRLITRGKGAGAPDLISTEFSPELHHKVDVLPWILCKGDWSRFHSVRPPNNGLACTENPTEPVFQLELREAQEY